ncbi:MAG: hypothetical protein ACRDOI_24135, partial [Trebonia sp.]
MMTPDLPGPGVTRHPEAVAMRFESILFNQPGTGSGIRGPDEPDYFADLNLDQVLKSMTAGRARYELEPLFCTPLHEVDAVRYRHEVLRDLEKREVLESVNGFAEKMQRMRQHLDQAQGLHHQLQQQAWFLDAVEVYCQAVRVLAEELAGRDVISRGFHRFRRYLAEYAGSGRLTSLAAETQELKDALARIRYAVRIHGPRVTVSRYEGEPDYGAEVEETFAKFKQGAVQSYLVTGPEYAEMDHVEAQIVGLVARLYPNEFGTLAGYCARHRDYLDPVIGRFDREVQFYLAYLELAGRFRAAGLPFCYPDVSASSKETTA